MMSLSNLLRLLNCLYAQQSSPIYALTQSRHFVSQASAAQPMLQATEPAAANASDATNIRHIIRPSGSDSDRDATHIRRPHHLPRSHLLPSPLPSPSAAASAAAVTRRRPSLPPLPGSSADNNGSLCPCGDGPGAGGAAGPLMPPIPDALIR